MKKRMVWLIAAAAAFGLSAQAEMVITSPTGLPDEKDVVLKSAVDAVKETPAETVKAVGDVVSYTRDELRNTAHGIAAAFEGDTPRESTRQEMLAEVDTSWDRSGEIVFRSYKVSPAVGRTMAGTDTTNQVFLDVNNFFSGVDFPEGASARFQPEYGKLLVRNTLSNIHQIENMLAKYHHAERDYRQVEIKAKFIEVSQSKLNELGFTWDILEDTELDGNWQVNKSPGSALGTGLRSAAGAFGGTIGSGSMVLTKDGWMPLSLTINALEQDSDSDVLSSPSLTTVDGKAAEIWVGEDRAVPKAFSVASDDINIHIEHKNWNSELMGVYLSVTPEILKNDIIRLSMKPKIIDLLGYDTYQVSPEANMLMVCGANLAQQRIKGTYPILNVPAAGITKVFDLMNASVGNSGGSGNFTTFQDQDRQVDHETSGTPLARIYGELPSFRVRAIETQVDVADGSTVGLGGLIYDRLETYKDKVPVLGSIPLLGRLFRSEGERSIKRNLMIFVSAGQIASDGQRKSDVALNK